MGKVPNANPITHFTHPHPLHLTHLPVPFPFHSSTCSACKHPYTAGAAVYACATCNFFLHKNCFDLPKKITHPFHKQHVLTLLPVPAYPDGLFHCDACAQTGTGFSYHCKPCGVDLHALCAAMPMSVTHAAHTHKLELVFDSPYSPKEYSCDICTKLGSGRHWLYRCGTCGFDAHLNCARGTAVPPVHQTPANVFGNPNAAAFGIPVGPQVSASSPFVANRQGDELAALLALQQMINNNNNAMMNQARFNHDAMQQLMQMMSSFNNNGSISGLNAFGGGGGGGSIPGLNAFGGGGGGGSIPGLNAFGGGGGGGSIPGLNAFGGGGGDGSIPGFNAFGGGGGDGSIPGLNAFGGGGGGGGSIPGLNAFGGGGGGGGGSIPGLNAFGGGGGGLTNLLQTLINSGGGGGGGGGGLDFLQNMVGGSGGGLNDLLGGFLGGFS